MADNVTTQSGTLATPPAAEVFAFDEVTINATSVKVGRNKLGFGADGSYTEVSASDPFPTTIAGVSTAANQSAEQTLIGAVTETAPATDTASSGLNGRLQRIAQRLTSIIALLVQFVTGGGTEAAALRVTVASDSTGLLSVDDNGGSLTVDAASLPLPTGASTLAEQQTQTTALQLIDDVVATLGTTTYTEAATKGSVIGAVRRDADTTLVDTTNEIGPLQMDANGRLKVEAFSGETLPVSLTSTTITGSVDTELPTAAALADNTSNPTVPGVGAFGMVWDGATWDRAAGTSADGTLVNLGANNDVTVTGTVTTSETNAATGTRTQVADSATDVSILASNASRRSAGVFNDSSAILYLGLGTTAVTTTNYTVKLYQNTYYETPLRYTGEIRGIWASDPGDGAARVTELT